MNDYNLVVLTGRLTRDPELRYTGKGSPVCSFATAVNRYWRADGAAQYSSATSYIDVTTFADLAERCSKGLAKGTPVRITGRLQQDRWSDPTGESRSKVVVIADRVEWRNKTPTNADADATDAEPAPHELAPELGD